MHLQRANQNPLRPALPFLNRLVRIMVREQANLQTEPTFRRPELRDVDALVEFRFRLLYETHFAPEGDDQAAVKSAFREYFERHITSGEFIGWVAEVDGIAVATGGMVFWHKPPLDDDPTGKEAYIMNM